MGSLLSDQSKIGGQGEFVEIDESMLYRRKYNVGRILGSGWLFGGIQRSDKSKVFLAMVPDRTAETLLDVIQQRILPGTTIVSDCWRSYFHIGSFGYTHLTVNHSVNFVDPLVPEAHTQNIECTWRWVKKRFLSTTKDQQKRITRLWEFIYRRVHQNELFSSILFDISQTEYP